MNSLRLSVGLAALGALAAPGLAQLQAPQSALLLVDDLQNQDQLILARDLDGDGFFAAANELATAYQNNGDWVTTVEYTQEAGVNVAYWIDQKIVGGTPANGLGAIYRGADTNGDSQFTGGEVQFFYNYGALIGKAGGDGLAVTADGAVWWTARSASSLTAAFKGLFRSKDLNNDGDAEDAGETVQLINGLAGPFTVETDAGPRTMDATTFRRMAEDGNGVVVYEDGADECAFRFEDKNSDGDLLDAGEARLFFNPTGKNVNLPKHPDWGSAPGAALRDLTIPNATTPTSPFYARLSHVATRDLSGTRMYLFGCDSSNTSQFKSNVHGEYVNGLIYFGIDYNLDGDINDTGEVGLFYDGSFTSYAAFEIGKIVGLDGSPDGVYVGDYNGANSVHYMQDLTLDLDANDAGEQDYKVLDSANFVGAPPIPLQPFVNDIAWAPAGTFNYGWQVSGTSCSQFGFVPQIAASGSAKIGASTFVVRVLNAKPGSLGLMFLGASTTTWLGIPLPLDLTFFNFPGCFLYQDMAFTFKKFVDAQGTAAQPLAVPNNLSLVGFQVPLQWTMIDVLGAGQFAFSALGQVTIQQ